MSVVALVDATPGVKAEMEDSSARKRRKERHLVIWGGIFIF